MDENRVDYAAIVEEISDPQYREAVETAEDILLVIRNEDEASQSIENEDC